MLSKLVRKGKKKKVNQEKETGVNEGVKEGVKGVKEGLGAEELGEVEEEKKSRMREQMIWYIQGIIENYLVVSILNQL